MNSLSIPNGEGVWKKRSKNINLGPSQSNKELEKIKDEQTQSDKLTSQWSTAISEAPQTSSKKQKFDLTQKVDFDENDSFNVGLPQKIVMQPSEANKRKSDRSTYNLTMNRMRKLKIGNHDYSRGYQPLSVINDNSLNLPNSKFEEREKRLSPQDLNSQILEEKPDQEHSSNEDDPQEYEDDDKENNPLIQKLKRKTRTLAYRMNTIDTFRSSCLDSENDDGKKKGKNKDKEDDIHFLDDPSSITGDIDYDKIEGSFNSCLKTESLFYDKSSFLQEDGPPDQQEAVRLFAQKSEAEENINSQNSSSQLSSLRLVNEVTKEIVDFPLYTEKVFNLNFPSETSGCFSNYFTKIYESEDDETPLDNDCMTQQECAQYHIDEAFLNLDKEISTFLIINNTDDLLKSKLRSRLLRISKDDSKPTPVISR
ncbi:unnamed protein product [Moneuplotes crassus]|uniref:Uncharacterized protein n=1 Tax=Euplotes crassus TaxID=5936 RepID=A0AAD1UN03_EUPCR|nr:unnamed protein product [Moneuplotes crassus]